MHCDGARQSIVGGANDRLAMSKTKGCVRYKPEARQEDRRSHVRPKDCKTYSDGWQKKEWVLAGTAD